MGALRGAVRDKRTEKNTLELLAGHAGRGRFLLTLRPQSVFRGGLHFQKTHPSLGRRGKAGDALFRIARKGRAVFAFCFFGAGPLGRAPAAQAHPL